MNETNAKRSRFSSPILRKAWENRWAVFFLLIILGSPSLSYFLEIRSGRQTFPYFQQVAILVVLLGLLFYFSSLRSYFQGLRLRHRAQLLGLLGTMLIAQGIGNNNTTFPFMPWKMYQGGAVPPDRVKVFQYFAITSTGEKVRMNPSRLFPSNGRGYRRMSNKLISVCSAYAQEQLKGNGQQEAKIKLEEFMRAVGLQFQRKNPQYEVKAVQIDHHYVPWKNTNTFKIEGKETLLSVNI